jgi:hypothetical protein
LIIEHNGDVLPENSTQIINEIVPSTASPSTGSQTVSLLHMKVHISQVTYPLQISGLKFRMLFIVSPHIRTKMMAKFIRLIHLLLCDKENVEMSLPRAAM